MSQPTGHCRQKFSSIHSCHTTTPCTCNAFRGHLIPSLRVCFSFRFKSADLLYLLSVFSENYECQCTNLLERYWIALGLQVCWGVHKTKLNLRNLSVKMTKASNCTELEQVVHTSQDWSGTASLHCRSRVKVSDCFHVWKVALSGKVFKPAQKLLGIFSVNIT